MWGLEGKRFWWLLAIFVVGLAALICYRGLPDTVYGALVALGGVILTTLHGGAMRKADLDNTVLQKRTEREMALRREVFLPAFEGATRALNAIGLLLDSGKQREDISSAFADGIAALTKAMLVASPPTIARIQSLAGELSFVWSETVGHRVILDQIAHRAKGVERERDLEIELRQTAIKHLQSIHVQSNSNSEAGRRAHEAIQAHEQRIAAMNAKLDEFGIERDRLYLNGLKPLINRLSDLRPMFPPVLAELRKEMELPFEQEAFAKAQEAITTKILVALQSRITEAEQRLAALQASRHPTATGPQVGNG
ncbi:hypothetical protein [Ralstonia sp.]|uniref:hypothetical protein n=1 Tax=Ralstonia sp. TaxID=54061 RepID=UPI0031D284FB